MLSRDIIVSEYLKDLANGLYSETEVSTKVEDSINRTLEFARKTESLAIALNVAAFVSPHRISLELLGGGSYVAVDGPCNLNLLRQVRYNEYSSHRLHQLAAQKGELPSEAIAAVEKM